MESNKIYNEDCIEGMKKIEDKSIDMILCDLPYGTTQCKWDECIPFSPMWEQYKRVCKDNAAIVLFSAQPFTTDLIGSNRKMFKYEWIWQKTQPTGFYNAKKAPLRAHENICVFYQKQPVYNPQKYHLSESEIKDKRVPMGRTHKNSDYKKSPGKAYGRVSKTNAEEYEYTETGERYPKDVIKMSNWNGALFGDIRNKVKHPTQKPVGLFEYLIRTYTHEGDVVLDNCMGSGTTAVACINTGRNYIGFELDEGYYKTCCERVNECQLTFGKSFSIQ